MSKSREKLMTELNRLHKERRRLIRHLKKEGELVIGTVSIVNRKCGSPNCHCADGLGHPQTLFLFQDKKQHRRICKLVRREDEPRMLKAGERYRKFREAMKQLRAIDFEEKQILMALAEGRSISYK